MHHAFELLKEEAYLCTWVGDGIKKTEAAREAVTSLQSPRDVASPKDRIGLGFPA